jgi:histidinol-phosphatase
MADDLETRLQWARQIAREAGQLTLRYFQTADLAVEQKHDYSPVTVADRSAEQLLRARIAERFPADGVLGEEFGESPGASGFRWILDPIDGTRSFIRGVPLYGTMVAVERDEQAVVGVVFLPGLDEMAYAALGQGAWHQRGSAEPRRARVSQHRPLSKALITSSDTRFPTEAKQKAYLRLQQECGTSRTWGDCYGYVLIATGRAEVMIDPVMHVWDTAAVSPIVVEAGGTFTDWQGNPTIHAGEAIATNGHVLDEVLAITRQP